MVPLSDAVNVILQGIIAVEWPDKDEETHLKEKDERKEVKKYGV